MHFFLGEFQQSGVSSEKQLFGIMWGTAIVAVFVQNPSPPNSFPSIYQLAHKKTPRVPDTQYTDSWNYYSFAIITYLDKTYEPIDYL